MFLIRERLIQHAHVVASVGPCVVLGTCVGQIASSKGLASKFLIVVIINLRMIAWGGQAKEGHCKFSYKVVNGLSPHQKEAPEFSMLVPFKSRSQSIGRLEK